MKFARRCFPRFAGALTIMFTCVAPTLASDYPKQPIRLLLGYTPGGAADATARSITPKLSEVLGQPVVIEYKPGAGGGIAAEAAARATPDGYTLHLIDSGAMTILPNIRKVSFDPLSSFTPIGMAADSGLVLVTHPSLPAKTFPELVKLLKDNPGQYSYATSGVGGGGHVAAEQLKIATGTSMQHVAYRGGGPAMADLIGGQIPLAMSTLAPAIPQIRAGTIRALGVTSSKRSAAIPDIPTIAEQGVDHFEALNWFAFVGPAGLPDDVVQKVNAALKETLANKDVQHALQEQGLDAIGGTPEALMQQVRADLSKWKTVVQTANITTD